MTVARSKMVLGDALYVPFEMFAVEDDEDHLNGAVLQDIAFQCGQSSAERSKVVYCHFGCKGPVFSESCDVRCTGRVATGRSIGVSGRRKHGVVGGWFVCGM